MVKQLAKDVQDKLHAKYGLYIDGRLLVVDDSEQELKSLEMDLIIRQSGRYDCIKGRANAYKTEAF